jgi:hypothetical protein
MTFEPDIFHNVMFFNVFISLTLNSSYKKHMSDVESITSNMDYQDISDATNHNRCRCFKKFCDDLTV